MKKYLFSVAMAASMVLTANAQYKIVAHLDSIPDGMVYLQLHGRNSDSTIVKNGSFVLTGNGKPIKGADYIYLTDNKSWGVAFWMGNDQVTLKSGASKRDFTIQGSKTQDEYEEYLRVMKSTWDEGRKALAEIRKNTSLSDEERQRIEDVYHAKEDSVFMTFAHRFPASYVVLNHIFNKRVLDKYPYPKYSEMAKVLTPGAFEGDQWDDFVKLMNKDLTLEPGHVFPAFSMNDVYGKNVNIADFKGKNYVLFTLSNYGVSDYNSNLKLRRELYTKYHQKGLEMVDYMMAGDMINVIKPAANFDLKWRFLTDLKSWDNPWLNEHAIDHITQNFLIDKNGVIIAKNLFGDDLVREIEKIF